VVEPDQPLKDALAAVEVTVTLGVEVCASLVSQQMPAHARLKRQLPEWPAVA
jgi:hypothetical protein